MAAETTKIKSFSVEELLEDINCFFNSHNDQKTKEMLDREISPLFISKQHNYGFNVLEMTPVETEQNSNFFDLNSIRPVKHL